MHCIVPAMDGSAAPGERSFSSRKPAGSIAEPCITPPLLAAPHDEVDGGKTEVAQQIERLDRSEAKAGGQQGRTCIHGTFHPLSVARTCAVKCCARILQRSLWKSSAYQEGD